MIIWKNVKKYWTEGLRLNLNKDRLGHRRTERTQENINFQEKLIEDLEYQPFIIFNIDAAAID